VALVVTDPRVGGTRGFTVLEPDGRTILASGRDEQWRVERQTAGAGVRAVRPNGVATPWHRMLLLRSDADGFVTVNGKRYRGTLTVVPVDVSSGPGGLAVVNHVAMEDYLRGVVPVEMGKRAREERAALEAQAVASRSYAYARLAAEGQRPFDMRSSTADQVYGGADAEYDLASAAVDATRGLVIRFGGRVADAVYSSTCGGSTAERPEVWGGSGLPYLKRVSDRVGAGDRHYCDIAPRYRWTRTLDEGQLNAALTQYLKDYTDVPGGRPGQARNVVVRSRTPSGRVGTLAIETERGTFPVRGNESRYVLRTPGGEILPSAYFSVEPELGRDGLIARVTLRGQGYGHGVGMCQWGAIGRARAGQTFRTILGTYYPGTSVAPVQ
jgi:stage II sporulation protein D